MLLNIFMVNFPTTSARDGFIPTVEMVEHLVPEATVTKFDPLGGRDSDVNLPSDWITSQARSLLGLVRDSTSNGAAILLSGYGLGGILVKQAIATANSDPEFYHLASQVTSLVFFNTPHEPTGHQPWEGVFLELIKTTSSTRLQKRLYAAVPGLARHVSKLSDAFVELEPKYRIRNIVSQHYQQEHITNPTELPSRRFGLNSLRTWDKWPDAGELGECALDKLPGLDLLREVFAPTWPEKLVNKGVSEAYVKVLEVLSPSDHIICENRASDATNFSESLKAVHEPDFRGIYFEKIRGGCVLVSASEGTGKSAAVKLLSQHLRTQSSLVVINNYPRVLGNMEYPMAFYEVLVSTLRQILSQKPSLLTSALQTTLSGLLLHQRIWGEGMMESLLSVLFAQARDTEFLVVVHDYQSRLWPDKARDWWSQLPKSIEHSHGTRGSSSTCTLLISRNQPAAADPDPEVDVGVPCYPIDLTKRHRLRISDFVGRELVRIVTKSRSATSGLLRDQRGVMIRQEVVAKAEKFPGSIHEIGCLLDYLLQSITLSTQGAILKTVEDSPRTSDEFYRQAISRLSKDETLRRWATATLSWALSSARPLQVQELACAAAIRLDRTLIGEMDETLDMEADITNNLYGLLRVENGYVRVATATAKEALRKYTGPGGATNSMELLGDDRLLKHCLHYLKVLLGGESWRPGKDVFLDYATRYWPAHLSAIKNPDSTIYKEVVEFLQSPAADRWYSLYLGHRSPLPYDTLACPRSQQGDETAPFKPEDGLKPSQVEMAHNAGLWPVASYLLAGDHVDVGGTHRAVDPADVGPGHLHVTVWRGGWKRKMDLVEGIASKLYLECAIATDDVGAVATLLSGKDETVRKTIWSHNPLHIAALLGSPRMIQVIANDDGFGKIEASAVDEHGRNPLHLAAVNGQPEMVRALLSPPRPGPGMSQGPVCDPAARDKKNLDTPLLLAVRAGNASAARILIEFARSRGEPVTDQDKSGRRPAHHAVDTCPPLLKDLLTGESAEELVQKDGNGLTPLHYAARGGCVEATTIILDIARGHDKLDVVISAQDDKGRLPVHYVAENGHCAVSFLFLKNMGTLKGPESLKDREGDTPESLAAMRGHLKILQILHGEGGKEWDAMLLAKAAAANQLLIVEYLLSQGVSPDGSPDSGTTPLCEAATGGFVQVVRSLLRRGARINLPNGGRQAPLYLAVKHKRQDVALLLLDSGPAKGAERVFVDAPDSSRLTALHMAALNGETPIAKVLIERGADVESRSRTKQIPLHLAAQAGQLEAARLLVNEKSDSIYAMDNKSKSPITYAIEEGNLAMVQVLFKRINAQPMGGPAGVSHDIYSTTSGQRDVVPAVEKSAVGILDIMLHLFPDILQNQDSTNLSEDSTLLLHIAARDSTAETVALLLELGMDVTMADVEGRIPLHVAALHENTDAIKELLKKNPDLEAVDESGKTPLLTAIHEKSRGMMGETCRLLLEAKADVNESTSRAGPPLFEASYFGHVEVVQVLLEFGADVDEPSHLRGMASSLHAAADNLDISRMLVGKGANVNHQKSDLWTPLHMACYWDSGSVVQFLLESNADTNLVTSNGDAPLHLALIKDFTNIVQVLINHNATSPRNTVDFELPGQQGRKPIHIAAIEGCKDTVEAVAQQVGDLGLKPKTFDGFSCLELATLVENAEAVAVLLEVGKWEHKELVKSLQDSIETGNWNIITLFINKDSSLLDATSVDGDLTFTLEIFFDKVLARDLSKSASMAASHQFFADQCQEKINKVTPKLAFRCLRFATELDDSTFWDRLMDLGFGGMITSEMEDQDRWTIKDHVFQSNPRIGHLQGITEASLATRVARAQPAAMVLPEDWRTDSVYDGSTLLIKQGGTEIDFRYRGTPISLRSAHAFPPRSMGDVYFEITIEGEAADLLVVTIGFCGEFSNLREGHPGWKRCKWSIGYHGDDGGIFDGSNEAVNTDMFRFGPGNTVGSGIDFAKKQCFFTLDGRVVLTRESTGIFRKVYPCISHRWGAAKVKINYGPEGFMWNKNGQSDVGGGGLRRRPTAGLGTHLG